MNAQWPAPQPDAPVQPHRRFYAGWTRKTWVFFLAGIAACLVLLGPAYIAVLQILAKY